MTTPAEQASERLTSKHADLLNVLDAMAGNMHYAVRRQELRQAEQLIVEQEEALDSALARAERAEARRAECERERDAYHAQFKGIGITPYLERMRELSKRAEKAEAEVRELREEITRLRECIGHACFALWGQPKHKQDAAEAALVKSLAELGIDWNGDRNA
jgi:chromosome segregation ATPase